MASYELKNTHGGHEAREVSSCDRDDFHLQRLGKAPVLKVGAWLGHSRLTSDDSFLAEFRDSFYPGV